MLKGRRKIREKGWLHPHRFCPSLRLSPSLSPPPVLLLLSSASSQPSPPQQQLIEELSPPIMKTLPSWTAFLLLSHPPLVPAGFLVFFPQQLVLPWRQGSSCGWRRRPFHILPLLPTSERSVTHTEAEKIERSSCLPAMHYPQTTALIPEIWVTH